MVTALLISWRSRGLTAGLLAVAVLATVMMLSHGYGAWMQFDGRALSFALGLVLVLHLELGRIGNHRSAQRPQSQGGIATFSLLAVSVGFLSLVWSVNVGETAAALLAVISLLLIARSALLLGSEVALHTLSIVAATVIAASIALAVLNPALAFEQSRLRGVFDNANEFAAFSVLASCLLVGRVKRSHVRIALEVALGVMVVATGSRAALASFIVGLVVYEFGRSGRLTPQRITGILAFFGLLLILGAFAGDLFEAAATSNVRVARLNNSRDDEWRSSLAIIEQMLPWGAGYSALPQNPFSSYLKVLGEFGWTGALIMAAFVILALKTGAKGPPTLRSLVAAGASNAVFESWLFTAGSGIAVYFWVTWVALCIKEES